MVDGENVRTTFLEDGADAPFDRARVAILPVPHEATVCYGKGTARGPAAILAASVHLELYDARSDSIPAECGVWTDRALDLTGLDGEGVETRIETRAGELLDAGKWLLMLGGEHSITPGGVRAAVRRYPGLHVVQLDAHADLRESYEGSRWSHACAMARCIELAPVHAIGIRSYSDEERQRIRAGISGYRLTHAWEMQDDEWIEMVMEDLRGRNVYLSVDLDYFDPSILPATGTPVPGGGPWWPTQRFLERLFRDARVVAADIVELAPAAGLHHADFTAATLAYNMIGFAAPRPS